MRGSRVEAGRGVVRPQLSLLAVLLLCAASAAADHRDAPAGREAPVPRPEQLERWRSLSPERQEELRRRYQRFKKLAPEQQRRVRKNLRRWRELPEAEQRVLRDRFRRFKDLPPEKRQRLEKRLRDMTPDQREPAPRRHQKRGKQRRQPR